MAPRDPWLARWLPLIGERAAGLPVFERGCGGGRDSEVLAAAGHRIVGTDRCTIRAATQRLFARGRHALSLEERVIDGTITPSGSGKQSSRR